MSDDKTLFVVHCIDTEGPLDETIDSTFKRLKELFGVEIPATPENLSRIQNRQLDLGGIEDSVAECFSPKLLEYNSSWEKIDEMLDELLAADFKKNHQDDFGNDWRFSWHCMDHVGIENNPRHKDLGYGNVFQHYLNKLQEHGENNHEMNWHFHPLSITKNATHAATSFTNNMNILNQILCRRILDYHWFPVVNRPGFHSERSDANLFLEQWIPFDYANQFCEEIQSQPDAKNGRFGNWSRASSSWRGYHPSHDDYQAFGNCKRIIFRCLNVGTRLRLLREDHVREAFVEASEQGSSILSFADHDWRDIRPDIEYVISLLTKVRQEFPDVRIRYAGAEEAAIQLLGFAEKEPLQFDAFLSGNQLIVELKSGKCFGPQPFLAIETTEGSYYTDNFDELESNHKWSYIFDDMTLPLNSLKRVGVGSAGRYGGFHAEVINLV
jgi:hypothetical protein